jgi:predicted short-subunit dehydrogenase-like oxidoreductase (DUF2520 family)
MMKVSFIGSGNVATILARQMFHHGFTIIDIYSKQIVHAQQLAETVSASAIDDLKNLRMTADIFIIAVNDNSIQEITNQLSLSNKLVLHTAGSVSITTLEKVSENYGVLYPIQTLRKEMNSEIEIPFMIDGNNLYTKNVTERILNRLQQSFVYGNDEQRLKIHIAAVFASNFVNYLYHLSAEYCTNEQINFSLLQPIIEQTAMRLKSNPPGEVFTGPAFRGDKKTIETHLSLLKKYPDMQKWYALITNNIQQLTFSSKELQL